ncbi:hypothetical protein [Singulisphaera sp. PoT]|uniref:hypothetical protein n=1 Tax=Singulisphaera sp. PoT TaxID=3411797 RepID=UPI003BF60A31
MSRLTRTVLIIAGHTGTRRALDLIFRQAGWRTLTALTTLEGFGHLHLGPSCVLLDLPDSGREGEMMIDRVEALGLQSRVVVISGTEDVSGPRAGDDGSPHVYLAKPVNLSRLFSLFDPEDLAWGEVKSMSRRFGPPPVRRGPASLPSGQGISSLRSVS